MSSSLQTLQDSTTPHPHLSPSVTFCSDSLNTSYNMHPLFSRADELSKLVIGSAIEVHRHMGPGLLESIYEKCMIHELESRDVPVIRQELVRIHYKDFIFDEVLKFDLLVDGCLLIEIKAVQDITPIHKAQLLSYMKLLDVPVGLLLNFHEMKLTDGLSRMYLPGCNRE